MGFEALLGNERLKEYLSASLKNNRISHFYLISGPTGSGKHTLARLLASAVLCRGQEKPCGACLPCRKVMEGNHPDFITVADPEHKNVAVKIIRDAREDAFICPNESEHKIYMIAQEMGVEGQNALLKILEEPPTYGIFLLLADNPEKLLPTVRSRCVELKMSALPENILKDALKREFPDATQEDIAAAAARSGGFLGQAKNLLQKGLSANPQTQKFGECFAAKDNLGLLQTLVPMEKWKRDALIEELNSWIELLTEALSCRAGMNAANELARRISQSRSGTEIRQALNELQKCLEYAHGNVSAAAICGWLTWALR